MRKDVNAILKKYSHLFIANVALFFIDRFRRNSFSAFSTTSELCARAVPSRRSCRRYCSSTQSSSSSSSWTSTSRTSTRKSRLLNRRSSKLSKRAGRMSMINYCSGLRDFERRRKAKKYSTTRRRSSRRPREEEEEMLGGVNCESWMNL